MSRYSKALVAVVGAIATWASTYYPDSPSVQKWVGLALAIVTVASVYLVPNEPPKGKARRPDISEQGQGPVELLIYVVVAIVVVLFLVWLISFLVGHTH